LRGMAEFRQLRPRNTFGNWRCLTIADAENAPSGRCGCPAQISHHRWNGACRLDSPVPSTGHRMPGGMSRGRAIQAAGPAMRTSMSGATRLALGPCDRANVTGLMRQQRLALTLTCPQSRHGSQAGVSPAERQVAIHSRGRIGGVRGWP
jgi:hypothetical protein